MKPKTSTDVLLATLALFGALGVVLGAFGAHGMRETLEIHGGMEAWKTAVFYNLAHVTAGIAVLSRGREYAGPVCLWIVGICLFSGSLCLLALGGSRWLGPVTPLGGALLIAGWLWLAIKALTRKGDGVD